MSEKQQSAVWRDLFDPGWREREAEQHAKLMAAFEARPRPTCAVRGMIQPRAMCGSVIVGGYQCGYKGTCEHQRMAGEVKEPSQCP